MSQPPLYSTPSRPRPTAGAFLRVWLLLGLQSFGGGAATLALVRRAVVEQQGWLSAAEFAHTFSLVQVAPGINLLALTIVIGRRVAGAWGVALALLGLLLPSVGITLLLTAGYAHIQHSPWTRAALRGVVPGTVGLGLVTALQIGRPLLRAAHRDGASRLTLGVALLLGSALASAFGHWPVVGILGVAAAVSAFAHWLWSGNDAA